MSVIAHPYAGNPEFDGVERDALSIEQLVRAVSSFVARMDRQHVSGATAMGIQRLLQAWRHYDTVLGQVRSLLGARTSTSNIGSGVLDLEGPLADSFREVLRAADPGAEGFSASSCERAVGRMEERFDALRDTPLASAAEGALDVSAALAAQHFMAEARRAARHLARGARVLDSLDAPERGADLD